MARFSIPWILLLTVAACSPAAPVPGPSSSAPVPREYTCAQNKQAGEDFRKLPAASPLRTFLDDYRIERKALRAFHNLPEPTPCS